MKGILACCLVILVLFLLAKVASADPKFVRGDVNADGKIDITDPQNLTNWLFNGTWGPPPCYDAADANNDSSLTAADPSYLYSYLFSGGPAPPQPSPNTPVYSPSSSCGCDTATPSDSLGCNSFTPCNGQGTCD